MLVLKEKEKKKVDKRKDFSLIIYDNSNVLKTAIMNTLKQKYFYSIIDFLTTLRSRKLASGNISDTTFIS